MADLVKPTAQEEFKKFRRYVEPMAVCWACHYHVYAGTVTCPHCGANVPQHAAKRARQLAELIQLKEKLEQILARASRHTANGEETTPRAPNKTAAPPKKTPSPKKAKPRPPARKPARKTTRSKRR